MNKDRVRNIIEATLKSGNKTPGIFDLPRILGVKNKLESCATISDVIAVLEDNRSHISRTFGLSDAQFNQGLEKLRAELA